MVRDELLESGSRCSQAFRWLDDAVTLEVFRRTVGEAGFELPWTREGVVLVVTVAVFVSMSYYTSFNNNSISFSVFEVAWAVPGELFARVLPVCFENLLGKVPDRNCHGSLVYSQFSTVWDIARLGSPPASSQFLWTVLAPNMPHSGFPARTIA